MKVFPNVREITHATKAGKTVIVFGARMDLFDAFFRFVRDPDVPRGDLERTILNYRHAVKKIKVVE